MSKPDSISVSERLSMLKDGELSELDLHRLLKELEHRDDLRNEWAQLHATDDVAAGFEWQDMGVSLADRVKAEITPSVVADASPEKPSEPSKTKRGGLFKLTQLAVAASVAAIVVITPSLNQKGELPSDFTTNDEVVFNLNRALDIPQVATRNVSTEMPTQSVNLSEDDRAFLRQIKTQQAAPKTADQMAAEQLLDEYLILHAQHASDSTLQGVLPYLKVEK